MAKTWRLILDGFGDGFYNMAVDEAIFLSYLSKRIPTLRIYGWEAPCISIGYNQEARNVLKGKEVPFVRRITGGASILHHREVTYSISCSAPDLNISPKIKQSYRQICSFLINFYCRLGLEAGFTAEGYPQGLSRYGNFCFSTRQHYDVIIKGKKIGGNAQRRKRDIIFQQGSIPQEIDFDMIEKTINNAGNLKQKTSGLDSFLGKNTDFYSLSRILADSFQSSFGLDLKQGELCAAEVNAYNELMNSKYKTKQWNLRNEKTCMVG